MMSRSQMAAIAVERTSDGGRSRPVTAAAVLQKELKDIEADDVEGRHPMDIGSVSESSIVKQYHKSLSRGVSSLSYDQGNPVTPIREEETETNGDTVVNGKVSVSPDGKSEATEFADFLKAEDVVNGSEGAEGVERE